MLIYGWLVVLLCGVFASALSIPDAILQRDLDIYDVKGNMTHLPISQIGFTQDSISSEVHIHRGDTVTLATIKTFLEEAKAQGDLITYFNAVFPHRIQVFYHTGYKKYLSIDNRRLCIFKATLKSTDQIEVEVFSQADIVTVLGGQAKYNRRLSTVNQGASVEVRGHDKWVCPPTS